MTEQKNFTIRMYRMSKTMQQLQNEYQFPLPFIVVSCPYLLIKATVA